MKGSLLRLIEYSILPAVVVILSKLGGIYLAAALFGIATDTFSSNNGILFFQTVVKSSDLIILSSYSDLFMFLGVAAGMSVILVQALYLHDSHIQPEVLNKLAKWDMLNLIRGSFELYHSGVMWLVFLWLAGVLVLINFIKGITDIWTLTVVSIFVLAYSVIFFKDLFAEIQLAKNGNN